MQWDSGILNGQIPYAGTVEGVRHARNSMPHPHHHAFTFKYVMIIISESLFKSQYYGMEFHVFLKKLSVTKEKGKLLVVVLPFFQK